MTDHSAILDLPQPGCRYWLQGVLVRVLMVEMRGSYMRTVVYEPTPPRGPHARLKHKRRLYWANRNRYFISVEAWLRLSPVSCDIVPA